MLNKKLIRDYLKKEERLAGYLDMKNKNFDINIYNILKQEVADAQEKLQSMEITQEQINNEREMMKNAGEYLER